MTLDAPAPVVAAGHAMEGPQYGHAVYAAVSLASMALVSILFGLRSHSLGLHSWRSIKSMSVMRCIVTGIYICGIFLMFSLGMMLHGIGLTDLMMCKLGIYLCLIFYVCGNKILMYLFLVERAHAIRAATHRRTRDICWWIGMFVVIFGFGTIVIICFVFPAYVRAGEHGCMMGLPPSILIPLLVYDLGMNVFLTSVFIFYLVRMLRFRGGYPRARPCPVCRTINAVCSLGTTMPSDYAHGQMNAHLLQTANVTASTRRLERLIKRSLLGAVLGLIPTVTNLTVLLRFHGYEQGWACFTGCSLDVVWTVCVVHWLTNNPSENDPGKLDSHRPEPVRSTSGVTTVTRSMTPHGKGPAKADVALSVMTSEVSPSPTPEKKSESDVSIV